MTENGLAGTDLRPNRILWRRETLVETEPQNWYEMYQGCVVSGLLLGIIDQPCKAGERITVTILWSKAMAFGE